MGHMPTTEELRELSDDQLADLAHLVRLEQDRRALMEQAECHSLKEVLGKWKQAMSGHDQK